MESNPDRYIDNAWDDAEFDAAFDAQLEPEYDDNDYDDYNNELENIDLDELWQSQPDQDAYELGYVDPDMLFNNSDENNITFIFTAANKLFAKQGEEWTHRDLVADNNVANEIFYDDPPDDSVMRRIASQKLALLGRIGSYDLTEAGINGVRNVLSFWNEPNSGLYQKLFDACADQLLERGFIDDNTIVSIPDEPLVRMADTIKLFGATKQIQDPQTIANRKKANELQMMLHLRPDLSNEQRDAMRRQIVVLRGGKELPPPTKRHPMQQAMEKEKLISPGQKWWTMHSEDITSIANMITEDPDIFQ